MQVSRRFRALFARPERKLQAILPQLVRTRERLAEVKVMAEADPLSALIVFFNITSPWEDRGLDDLIVAYEGVNYGQHFETLHNLRLLQEHLQVTGRNLTGWNRTMKGEAVTAQNVHIEARSLRCSFSIAQWLHPSQRCYIPRYEVEFRSVQARVRTFLWHHTTFMMGNIDALVRISWNEASK